MHSYHYECIPNKHKYKQHNKTTTYEFLYIALARSLE